MWLALYIWNGLLSKTLLDGSAELVVQGVSLFQQVFANTGEVSLLGFLGGVYNLVPELVVQIYGLVNEVCNFVCILARVHVQEKGAIVHKSTNHILNVLLDVSKIHIIQYYIGAKIAFSFHILASLAKICNRQEFGLSLWKMTRLCLIWKKGALPTFAMLLIGSLSPL